MPAWRGYVGGTAGLTFRSTAGRWPHYVPQALAASVRSQMALRLHLDEGTLGGINFYSTISDEVRDDARVLQTR
jgi:hypothetical protein